MRVCPGCRTAYGDDVSFCRDDGLPLIEVSQTFAPAATSDVPPQDPSPSGREGPARGGAAEVPAQVPEPVLRAPLQLEAGMIVGEYRIERHIATGGMGAIYAGIHPVISKRVAIKVLDRRLANDPRTLSRFVLEARSVNQIGHHNIVDIFSIGELDDGRAYLIMELLDGLPLHHLLGRAGRLEPGHVLPIYQQLCDALRAAHGKGFVHRDLKPDNIVVLRRPPHPFIKILDFGIAKLRHGDAGDDEATAVGTVLGTPEYMAPEQCKGEEIDHRTDIYALGVMLYELLCGKKPFSDPNPMRVLALQLRSDPAPPSSHVELPEALERVILKAMAKDAEARFASTAELLAALMQAITTLVPWTLDLSPLSAEAPKAQDKPSPPAPPVAPPAAPPAPATPSPLPAVPLTNTPAPEPLAGDDLPALDDEAESEVSAEGDDIAPPSAREAVTAPLGQASPPGGDKPPADDEALPPAVPDDAGDEVAEAKQRLANATTQKPAVAKRSTAPGIGPTDVVEVPEATPSEGPEPQEELPPREEPQPGESPLSPGEHAIPLEAELQVMDVDVPAPVMISGEFSFDLDELSRLATDDEEQTITAVVDPALAVSIETPKKSADAGSTASSQDGSPFPPLPALAPEQLPGISEAELEGPPPLESLALDKPTPLGATAPEGPQPAPVTDAVAASLKAPGRRDTDSDELPKAESLKVEIDAGYMDPDFIAPDDVLIGPTSIEGEALLDSLSSSELVIEHSLHEQTEQARSMHQAALVRRASDKRSADKSDDEKR